MFEGVELFEVAVVLGEVAVFVGTEAFVIGAFVVATIGFDALAPSAADRPTRVRSEIPEIVDFLNSVMLGK